MQGHEKVESEIRNIIKADHPDVFIVDIELHRGSRTVLSIWVDTDEGITIDTCARISRQLNSFFEEEDPFDFPFNLQVSSPGVGKPLKLLRQYHKNVGRKLKVTLEDQKVYKGRLEEVTDSGIVLRPEPKKKKKKKKKEEAEVPETYAFEFDNIREAKVEISFD